MVSTSVNERKIQIELYRILQNIISKRFSVDNIEFTGIRYEPTINGRPDLVVEAIDKGKKLSLLVIETKRKVPFIDRKFDPYSKDVIKQASGYAVELGAPYFATCNGEVLVLFDTFTAGVPLPQRRLKHYKVSFDEEFAKTILEEICRFRVGLGKWLELDDVFVQRLRTFHTFITPFMLESLNRQLRSDSKFKEKYAAWLKMQLFEYSQKMNERIAEQLAYILMNRLTFYKTLETQIPDLEKLRKIETEDPKEFSNKLKELFQKVCKDVDYQAIFEPHTILDQILLHKTLIYTLNDFIEELGTYDLAKIRSDVIGRVYEELIPPDERHRLGQYYTPPPIIELITEMCVKSSNDRVLDPACGSGGFLVKAYHKLKDLKKKENPFADDDKLHEEILNQLYGIDINPFPAQLSSINLAVRNLKVTSRNINLIVSDFFKVEPSCGIIPNEIDAVVTNPPYTDWREMEHREKTREVALKYKDGIILDVGKQAGIYVYFFTHGAKFLSTSGRMGLIVSDAWLDMAYGTGLKKFFLDFFKIKALIGHDTGVFTEPLVNTLIVILERAEDNLSSRIENDVRFCRMKKPMEIRKLIDAIENSKQSFENDLLKIELIKQGSLDPTELWGPYLRAPSLYFEIVKNPLMADLGKVSRTRIGLQTFADKFYVLNKDVAKTWGIEKKYLRKIVTSPKMVSKLRIDKDEITEFALVCSEAKENLENNTLKYVEWGEELEVKVRKKDRKVKGFNHLPRVQMAKRKPWYNLQQEVNAKGIAPILYPYMAWDKVVFLWNIGEVVDHQNFIGIIPHKNQSTLPLLAILNSSLTEFVIRCISHIYGGGVAKLRPSDIRKLRILDVEKLKTEERRLLSKLFLRFSRGNVTARDALDNVVFNILKLSKKERKEIFETIEELKRAQQTRKQIDALVETAEKWKPRKKPKREELTRSEPSKRLDLWTRDN
jgi:type I restriction-modification system DNA methylase subunit